MCGGTAVQGDNGIQGWGLSPRVRGNPTPAPDAFSSRRSIPACAGEPQADVGSAETTEVYPRVCGGTQCRRLSMSRTEGLSPRVRGNLGDTARVHGRRGSIPACAGEPLPAHSPAGESRVYPRVCGGTRVRSGVPMRKRGLSPRVRGNLGSWRLAPMSSGSIPACAGEPSSLAGAPCFPPVYPRVCGGTRADCSEDDFVEGLSPRVRGNLRLLPLPAPWAGSIPACAGEPP